MTHGSRIRVPALSRVEGEGGLELITENGTVTQARLDIYEPPRFFEALLRGRQYTEPPDITARICGICPVAYQLSACAAIEDACQVTVSDQVKALRRLLYCGEWIESHALHIYLLHAPDFLGYESGIDLARDAPDLVKRGLRIKKAGNGLMTAVGGRSVHPVNVKLGGFYRAPSRASLNQLIPELTWARDAAEQTLRWVGGFGFPDFGHDYTFVSMRHPDVYPITEGRVVASTSLDIAPHDYEARFTEFQVPHSTALHSVLDGELTYLTGPMARYALNHDRLPPDIIAAAAQAGLDGTCRNPFASIVVRSVELLYACDEALRLIACYQPPDPPAAEVPAPAQQATGCGWTEAPRGLLYHRYLVNADGSIAAAKIVPPTSQNQRAIEADLREFASSRLRLAEHELGHECERLIRSFDPCISCATHFLDLRVRHT